MEFYAVNGKRPARLSEPTRAFAYESMHYKYGLQTKATPAVALDDIANVDALSRLEQYDLAIERIAKEAPIRICHGEKISGSATLGIAINHQVPATFGGKALCSSVSHLTIDFETVLKKGINHIQKQAEKAYETYKGTEKEPFAKSCLRCLDAMRIWHQRYLDMLKDQPIYKDNYVNLLTVPFQPAQTFYQAVQSLWFTFAFTRLCGNWPGIGRIDWLLGDYLQRDLEEGRLTIDEAREILAHFFIKGCEWICGGNYGSGDAQHYQNIVLSGVDAQGNDVTNPITYLVLDIIEELGISDFPTTVRINKNTDPTLLKRVAQVIRYGGGVIAIYNEDLILDSLVADGYSLEEARTFANDGCWEIQIPGKTFFTYQPFDSLAILQQVTLKNYVNCNFADYETLYQTYCKDLRQKVAQLKDGHIKKFIDTANWQWKPSTPCTVVSLFEQGCIEKGQSYFEGGPIYNVISPHIGGLPDAANSLYAIKKLVFEERKVSFKELMQILKENWEGNETLRHYALRKYDYFGNDNDEVDAIAAQLVQEFAAACNEPNSPYRTPAGISTFGRQIEWSPNRMATPCGQKANALLSGNFSPTPATDRNGATAIIKSYCKADLRQTVSGAALDMKLLPSAVQGSKGLDAIIALIRSFCSLGGHFMQLDIADTALLKQAQQHPEEYPNLSVRVSGWSARFITLNKEWQDMIIAQNSSEF